MWTTTGNHDGSDDDPQSTPAEDGVKQIVPGVKIRTRINKQGVKQYYVPGHFNFFQIQDPTDKSDPVVSGPNGELYCPSAPADLDLTAPPGSSFAVGAVASDWGCSFDFQRGICYTPQKSTTTELLPDWRRSELEGNCGPLCPITGRPAAPVSIASPMSIHFIK